MTIFDGPCLSLPYSPSMADLAELIAALLVEGHSVQDATKIAKEVLARQAKSLTLSPSRTPERQQRGEPSKQEADEAYEIWLEQERSPGGVFSLEGVSLGGVFGGGEVSTASYDPTATRRHLDVRTQMQSLQIQQETLRLLSEIREDRKMALPSTEAPGARRLGKKRSR